MSRNEIRLRRKMMTSRRIERHKDYDALMNRYQKGSWAKRMIKWVVILVVILLSVYFALYIF